MKYSFILFAILIATVCAKCTSLQAKCQSFSKVKFTQQFNVNWKGIPTYYDVLSNVYSDKNCTERSYTLLYHNVLSCKDGEEKETFQCVSTTESVWVRIWKEEDNKSIIKNCGEAYLEKYQNVMAVNCTVNGRDAWDYLKVSVGTSSDMTVRMDGKKPKEYNGYHYEGECIWNYEIEGLWSGLVITILTCMCIVLVLFIALFIYAQKHRAEKRRDLSNRVLIHAEAKPEAV